MAVYKNIKEKTKSVSLPNLPDSKIEIYEDITYGNAEDIFTKEGSDMEKAINILVVSIKDWNLTDEQGVKLPITRETIRNFKVADVMFLIKEVRLDLEEDSKKKITKE